MRYKRIVNILKTYELAIVDACPELAKKLLHEIENYSDLFKCDGKLISELVSYQRLAIELL